MPQAFYRRQLPHLQCDDRQHFVTFCTDHRWLLPEQARSIVLECCLHDNGNKFDLRVAVVMPDHVHVIFTPLVSRERMEICSLAEIMDAIKGASAHGINKALGRKGRVWQANRLITCCARRRVSTRRLFICWRIRFGRGWPRNGLIMRGCGRRTLGIPSLPLRVRDGPRYCWALPSGQPGAAVPVSAVLLSTGICGLPRFSGRDVLQKS